MSTVLIVDDHASFRLQARALLEAEGHVVMGEAVDGLSAIELARSLRPEIVLLDVGLPDLDGFEVARQLATAELGPIVVLTSSREAATYGSRLASSAIAGFIPKEELSGPALAAVIARGRLSPGPRS
jgi:Response regulator containing a CheY-like receiver domain and an HTH DNA-binding domain